MRVLVPGRWQPLNIGHERHIARLHKYGNLVIGIRECGPFPIERVWAMFRIVFPDLEIVQLPLNEFGNWQDIVKFDIVATANAELGLQLVNIGYSTLLVPEIRPGRISSTKIRDKLSKGQSITGLVNPEIEDMILNL